MSAESAIQTATLLQQKVGNSLSGVTNLLAPPERSDSMLNAGLSDGDLIIIDRSLNPENGKIAVCFLDGEFTVKRIKKEKDKLYLVPENRRYKPIELQEENELIIWGIVEYVIKKV